MNKAFARALCAATSVALWGCPGPSNTSDAGPDRVVVDTPAPPDVAVAPDVPPPPFDAGPPPECMGMAAARHIVDRPGGDRVADPSSFVPVAGGFVAALRRFDFADRDGGVADAGGTIPLSRDSIELLPLGADGTPRGAGTVQAYDGQAMGTRLDQPVLLPTSTGGYLIFQEQRGTAGEPGYVLRLRSAQVNPDGTAAATTVLREQYGRPAISALDDGTLFGIAPRVEGANDAGVVTVLPVAMHLSATGMNLRAQDVNVNAWVPIDARETLTRAVPAGGAAYVMRTGGNLALLRFNAMAMVDTRGAVEVRGSNIAGLDDAAVAGDGVVAVYTRNLGARVEVHTVVAGLDGALRLNQQLEAFEGEGPSVATAARAYGGVALFWRRGVDANARVRVAVVSPDGVVRVPPADLTRAAGIEGRILAAVDGRRVSFLARDGADAARWGYTFGQACLP